MAESLAAAPDLKPFEGLTQSPPSFYLPFQISFISGQDVSATPQPVIESHGWQLSEQPWVETFQEPAKPIQVHESLPASLGEGQDGVREC